MNNICFDPAHKGLEESLLLAQQQIAAEQHRTQVAIVHLVHEIRTPLNVILGFTNLLLRADLPDGMSEYAESIHTAGMQLLALVKKNVESPAETVENEPVISTQILPKTVVQPESAPLIQVDELPDLSGYHVLLVEDNPMNRRMAEIHLREFGLEVTLAVNGREAVERLRSHPTAYDLVCMDIEMPEMDGYTATRMIRSELGLKELPIVAVTAHVFAGERDKVLASGMNDYLTKPVGHQEVVTLLMRYLSNFWNVEDFYALNKPENFQVIANLFTLLFPQELATLYSAIQKEDFSNVACIAHSMRSTVGYTGFQSSLGKYLMQIETQVAAAKPDTKSMLNSYQFLARDGQYAMSILQHEFLEVN